MDCLSNTILMGSWFWENLCRISSLKACGLFVRPDFTCDHQLDENAAPIELDDVNHFRASVACSPSASSRTLSYARCTQIWFVNLTHLPMGSLRHVERTLINMHKVSNLLQKMSKQDLCRNGEFLSV